MSKIYDKEYGLPSQYLLNKKKRPAKTDGKYLYYYVGASISDFPKGSKLKKYKNAYVCEIEVSLEEWECLVELDKAEYNANHKEDIEVYFVEDNIWTMDNDGELRLTIMATLAQEESRKTSERVRAGQKISRDNGVLYGNGNILGYDRVGGTYVINEEQAETVRIIYDLYLKGLGFNRIVNELIRLKRKDSSGQVRWEATKVCRILHNATYKG